MSKLTKNGLKTIIKECLLEILSEGLGSSINEVSLKNRSNQSLQERKFHEATINDRQRRLDESIKFASNGDGVLADIFAHTAQTTLKERAANEIPGQSINNHLFDSSEISQDGPGIDLTSSNVFAQASRDWSAMAFSAKKNRG